MSIIILPTEPFLFLICQSSHTYRLCERVQLGFRTARVRSQVVVEVVGVKGPVKDPRVLLLAPLRSWMKDRMHVRTIILGSPSHPFLTVAQPIIRVVGPDRVRVR